jgi:hypothetical protein
MRYKIFVTGGCNREFGFYFFLRFKTAVGALAALMILKSQLVLRFFGCG